MSAIGSVIGKAVDAATGSSSGTTLQDFLSQFSSSEGIWAKTIDPFASFDVSFKFYPAEWKDDSKDWKQKLADSLVSSAKNAVTNLANNATGGLVGAVMNDKTSIEDMQKSTPNNGYKTFMEYLATANMVVGRQGWFSSSTGETVSPLELNLGPYCQEITLPHFEIPVGRTTQTSIGEFPINGMVLKPDSNILVMKIVNTKVPLHERLFYPWMREVVSPKWHYNTQPYTTATITVDLTKHCDIKYVFCGCRPQKINMQQPTQDNTSPNLLRDVSFLFDYMAIHSSLKVSETLTEKLLSTGKSLVQSAGSLIQM